MTPACSNARSLARHGDGDRLTRLASSTFVSRALACSSRKIFMSIRSSMICHHPQPEQHLMPLVLHPATWFGGCSAVKALHFNSTLRKQTEVQRGTPADFAVGALADDQERL